MTPMGAPSDPVPARPVVVCVDDEPPILRAVERLLREEPYELLLTGDPEEALHWVKTREVSLVIADYRMPGMMGTDLLEEVAASAPKTRRILFTGYPNETVVLQGQGQGLYWLVGKPWDDEQLKDTIRRALQEEASGP